MASQHRRRLRWLAGASSLVLASVSLSFSAQGTEQPTPATEQPTPTAEETNPSEDVRKNVREDKFVYILLDEELHVDVGGPPGGTVTLEYQGKEYNLTEDESITNAWDKIHTVYRVNTGIRSLTDDTPILRYTLNGVSRSKEITFLPQLQKDLTRTPISRIKKEKGSKLTEAEMDTIFENAKEWYENAGYPDSSYFISSYFAANSSMENPERIVINSSFDLHEYRAGKTDLDYRLDIEYDIEKFIERVEPSTSTPVATPSSAPQNQDTPVSADKQADPTPTNTAAPNAAPTTPAASTPTKKTLAFTGARTTPLLALATILGATGLIMLRKRMTAEK